MAFSSSRCALSAGLTSSPRRQTSATSTSRMASRRKPLTVAFTAFWLRFNPYGQKIGTAEEAVLHRAIALAGGPELGRWEASWLPRLRRLPRSPNRSAQRSRRLLMVIAQEPTQSLPALNRLRLVGDIRITREQQDVTLALVIPLDMIMFDIFVQRPPQRALAQED